MNAGLLCIWAYNWEIRMLWGLLRVWLKQVSSAICAESWSWPGIKGSKQAVYPCREQHRRNGDRDNNQQLQKAEKIFSKSRVSFVVLGIEFFQFFGGQGPRRRRRCSKQFCLSRPLGFDFSPSRSDVIVLVEAPEVRHLFVKISLSPHRSSNEFKHLQRFID